MCRIHRGAGRANQRDQLDVVPESHVPLVAEELVGHGDDECGANAAHTRYCKDGGRLHLEDAHIGFAVATDRTHRLAVRSIDRSRSAPHRSGATGGDALLQCGREFRVGRHDLIRRQVMVRGAVLALCTHDDHFAADREVPLQGARRANQEHVAHTARFRVLQNERCRGRTYADASQGAR